MGDIPNSQIPRPSAGNKLHDKWPSLAPANPKSEIRNPKFLAMAGIPNS
jgi:hypothetical protein